MYRVHASLWFRLPAEVYTVCSYRGQTPHVTPATRPPAVWCPEAALQSAYRMSLIDISSCWVCGGLQNKRIHSLPMETNDSQIVNYASPKTSLVFAHRVVGHYH